MESTDALHVGLSVGLAVCALKPANTTATASKTTATAKQQTPFRIPSKLTLKAFVCISAVLSFCSSAQTA